VPLPARRQAGFSLIEIIVALLVAIILLAVSMPLFLRAYRWYRLTDEAEQMANILRTTRYQAIRLNKQVNCVIQPYSGGDPTVTLSASMTDASGNVLTSLGTGTMVLFGLNGTLVSVGTVPGGGTPPSNANLGSTVPTALPPTGGTVQFDARGAVISPTGVNIFYMASPAAADAGFRAVVLMTAGSIQIWSIDASGNWQEIR
jgi:type II secretory pathway pseudopilin PulG